MKVEEIALPGVVPMLTLAKFEVAMPAPLRLTTDVAPVDELLLMVSLPVATPMARGLNSTSSVAICGGFRVKGNDVAPGIVKPLPVTAADMMVTGAAPVEVKITD